MADPTTAAPSHAARRGPEPPDIFEKGGMKDGQPQRLNQRLFMQFLAFGGCADSAAFAAAFTQAGLPGADYRDSNGPRRVRPPEVHGGPGFFLGPPGPPPHSPAVFAPSPETQDT